jgi:hypothetical protein
VSVEEEEEEEDDFRELIMLDSEARVERRAKAWVTGVNALWSCPPIVVGEETDLVL